MTRTQTLITATERKSPASLAGPTGKVTRCGIEPFRNHTNLGGRGGEIRLRGVMTSHKR